MESSAHTLVSLLLKRIQEPDIHTSTIGKVKGCLNRIVIVLLHNTTVDDVDLLPFVYMLVYTFVFGDKPIKSNKNEGKYNDSKIEEKFHIKISKIDKSQSATRKESNKARINTSSVFQCNTPCLHSAKYSRMAHRNKFQEKEKMRKVIDGANAPKMTGKSRYKSLKYSHYRGLKDPASASAVYFGLSLIQ